jgi:hypothetical protein
MTCNSLHLPYSTSILFQQTHHIRVAVLGLIGHLIDFRHRRRPDRRKPLQRLLPLVGVAPRQSCDVVPEQRQRIQGAKARVMGAGGGSDQIQFVFGQPSSRHGTLDAVGVGAGTARRERDGVGLRGGNGRGWLKTVRGRWQKVFHSSRHIGSWGDMQWDTRWNSKWDHRNEKY